MIWRCVLCFAFVGLTLKSLLSHINSAHSRSPDFRVVCGIDGCEREYRVYNSLWYHIRRSHAEHLHSRGDATAPIPWRSPAENRTLWAYRPDRERPDTGPEAQGRPAGETAVSVEVEPDSHGGDDYAATADTPGLNPDPLTKQTHFGDFSEVSLFDGFEQSALVTSPRRESPPRAETSPDRPTRAHVEASENPPAAASHSEDYLDNGHLTKQATSIVLCAREKHHLSQSGVNDVIAAIQQYQAQLVANLRSRLQSVFQQHPGNELEEEAVAVFDQIEDPFATISTTYRQDCVIKKTFHYVDSEEVTVGYVACFKKKGAKRLLSTKPKSFHYIPLIKSLEQLLSHPKVLAIIREVRNNRNGYFYDIMDGDLMKTHPLFSTRPSALQIILYSDEIEICNPLGSHASKNKLIMFYYTLGNINPKYRSKLASIRLLAMANVNEISECGVDKILQRLHQDLVKLYNGVKIQTDDGDLEIYGAVVAICGDTLAQHELCGFKEGVGFAFSKCRQCECAFEDMQMYFSEDNFVKRTLERHVRQCSDIDKANTDFLKNSLKTTYGINRRSKLIEFPGFNMIKQTPQDIMHIILEGIAPLEIKCVIKHLVLFGQLDLEDLNTGIVGFLYSPLDVRDKPSPISYSTLASNDNKLKQSSGQMMVLLKILPFLLDKVKTTECCVLILELIEIVQILLSPVLSLQTIDTLKILIEQHLKHMKRIFPDNNITPKQHYLIHVPSQIKNLGPMIRHMCMRFESKHCFFKQWVSKVNFKNVCRSLIRHNQMYECCQNLSSAEHPIFSSECILGPTSEVKNMPYLREKARAFFGNDRISHAVSVKWLNLNGNKYISGKTLIVNTVSHNLPEFGLVKNIFVINSSLYCFEVQPYTTVCFDRDYMAYKTEIPNMAQATEFISSDQLVDYTPYYSYTHNDVIYVPLKYDLGDVMKIYSLV